MSQLLSKKKFWGQHFLHEQAVLDKIVRAINPQPADYLVEIGPGDGALTKKILPLVNQLNVVEIDQDLIPVLKKNCHNSAKLKINLQDVLQVDFTSFHASLRVIGNLPYNIATPLLFQLIRSVWIIQDLHFMMQKEVVERVTALPGSKIYGRLSVMIQYYFKVKKLFSVGSGAFTPPPKVESAMVRFIAYRDRPAQAFDESRFSRIVETAFSQRRKIIANSLKGMVTLRELEIAGVNPKSRPEQLTVADFAKISNQRIY